MWSNLPLDILSNIFSFLSPDSLACADSACRNWHVCARCYPVLHRPQPPWFVAMPSRARDPACCYLHNPNTKAWHLIRLDHVIPQPVRPLASIGSLLLLRPAASPVRQLSICNPFTKQVKHLPNFNRPRTNPALGILTFDSSFRIYLAGGMLEGPRGSGALYETRLEMYDSRDDTWRVVGSMPMELAVRLTVWTPNESVYSDGVVYWLTSARAYTVIGYDIGGDRWQELSVPLGDRLEFAALVELGGELGNKKKKKLVLVGGVCGEEACVWELQRGTGVILTKVPAELGRRLAGDKLNWGNTKCVGIDGAIFLYTDLVSGMVVWTRVQKEWVWLEGCTATAIQSSRLHNYAVRGLLLQPNRLPFLLNQPAS